MPHRTASEPYRFRLLPMFPAKCHGCLLPFRLSVIQSAQSVGTHRTPFPAQIPQIYLAAPTRFSILVIAIHAHLGIRQIPPAVPALAYSTLSPHRRIKSPSRNHCSHSLLHAHQEITCTLSDLPHSSRFSLLRLRGADIISA